MRSSVIPILFVTLAFGWLLPLSETKAADPTYDGKWTVKVDTGFGTEIVWLVELTSKEGKLSAKLLDNTSEFKGSAIKSAQLTKSGPVLEFTVPERPDFKVSAVEAVEKEKSIPALIEVQGNPFFASLDRFDKDKLPEKLDERSKHFEELETIFNEKDEAKRSERMTKFLNEKELLPGLRNLLTIRQITTLAEKAGNEKAITALADALLKAVKKYGIKIELKTRMQLATILDQGDKTFTPLALEQISGEKLLGPDVEYQDQHRVLVFRKELLAKLGKKEEIAAIETLLDSLFVKNNVSFEVKKYDGKATRTVVVELFTGAECPPCVAADVAFDAMLERYQPANVILLQYHMHIPGPDPLTNDAAWKRGLNFYELEGTPAAFLNGKTIPQVGGFRQHAEEQYQRITALTDKALEGKAGASLKLSAERKENKISVKADVADLTKTGEKVRLRFVLVEDAVKYVGGNAQRVHHHVVRDFPGGLEGFALDKKASSKSVEVDLDQLKKSLTAYLDEYAKLRRFPSEDRPLDLKHLKVVALIQDDATKEILAAEQVDVK